MIPIGEVRLTFAIVSLIAGTAVVFRRSGDRYRRTLGHVYFASLVLAASMAWAPRGEAQVDVIPMPSSVEQSDGPFRITDTTVVVVANPEMVAVVERQIARLRQSTGFPLPTASAGTGSRIRVVTRRSIPSEGYLLRVTPNELTIEAASEAGVYYAFQTLRQLLPRNRVARPRHRGHRVVSGTRLRG